MEKGFAHSIHIFIYRTSRECSKRTQKRSCLIQRKWVVLLAVFFSQFISLGLPFHMSVLYVELLHEFGKSKAETSLVQSMCTGTFLIGGVISGVLVARFGARKCGITGGILAASGFFMSYFATSITFLVGTIGVLSGFGFSIVYISSLASITVHFQGEQKTLALTFISYGSGIGAMVFPIIQEYLVQEYGWRGTVMDISGIIFNLVVCGAVYRPVSTKVTVNQNEEAPQAEDSDGFQYNVSETVDEKQLTVLRSKTDVPVTPRTKNDDNGCSSIFHGICIVLKNKLFVVFFLSLAMLASVLTCTLIFFVDFFEFKGYGRDIGVWNHFGLNLSNCVFRFLPIFMVKNDKIPKLATPALFALIGGFSMLGFPLAKSLPEMVVLSCLFGISVGGAVTILAITTLELVGQENYSTGLGITLTSFGAFAIVIGPVFGFIRDVTGSYDIPFFAGAGSAFCATSLLITTIILDRRKKHQKPDVIERDFKIEMAAIRRHSVLPWRGSVDFVATRSH